MWPKSAPHVALPDARQVFDSRPTRQPCSRARPPLPTCVRTPRRAPPCSLWLQMRTPELPRHPALALALPGTLPLRARPPKRRHHGRRRQASMPSLLPLLWPSCVCTECRYVSNASRRPSRAHFPVTTATVSPLPPEQPPTFRLCVRPGQPSPPSADLSSPTRVRRSLDAPRRFADAVDDHSRRSREPGRSPALPSRGGRRWTTRGNRRFSRGLSAGTVTLVNSA